MEPLRLFPACVPGRVRDADLAAAPAFELIELRPRLRPRHEAYLRRWLDAGRRMGLLDAEVSYIPNPDLPCPGGYALIWVREAPDPAYLVAPAGRRWIVRDHIRQCRLGAFPSLPSALDFIRPVLSPSDIV